MGKAIVIFATLVVIGASSTRAEEPKVAEVKRLGRVQSTSVKSQPIKIENLDELKAASQIYWVMLINSTDHMVMMVRVNKGKWALAQQQVGRTCNSTDYSNCFDAGSFHELVSVNCNSNAQIDVAWKQLDGSWMGAGWQQSFYADCKYKGGVIQLTN